MTPARNGGDVVVETRMALGVSHVFGVGSLLTARTPAAVLQVWEDRLAGRDAAAARIAT